MMVDVVQILSTMRNKEELLALARGAALRLHGSSNQGTYLRVGPSNPKPSQLLPKASRHAHLIVRTMPSRSFRCHHGNLCLARCDAGVLSACMHMRLRWHHDINVIQTSIRYTHRGRFMHLLAQFFKTNLGKSNWIKGARK